MSVRLKTKLSLGLSFLFVVILAFGILGIYNINRLSNDSSMILKNNYQSLIYNNDMLEALEDVPGNKNAIADFENILQKQEHNITEAGERETTNMLRRSFEALKSNRADAATIANIRKAIQKINDLNQDAILRKNAAVQDTADKAKFWLTIIFTVLTLVSFSFIFNLPGIISNPIRALSEGISEIANKNYRKRIFIRQGDEFGDLANAFNIMAERLDGYENSNLAKIQFEKKRIEIIINQMKDGIIGLDEKKHILFLNTVSESLLGLKEKDIIGKYAIDVALKNDLMRRLLQDETNIKDLKIYADNKESYFNKDILNVTDNEALIGQVIILRNITKYHELNEAKTNFIATVSHELKTPISSIKMSAKLLSDVRVGERNAEQQVLINGISDDADRLLKITGELLNMAQVETGNIQLKLLPTSPKIIFEKAAEVVQFQALQKKITLLADIASDLPDINVDAEKTTWVFINFMTNAIRYSPEGSNVFVKIARKENCISFSVKDQGPGIDEKYLPKIFDRYFKIPGKHESISTGLGLAISKEFIEVQGGTINVESTYGEGSVFSFLFKPSAVSYQPSAVGRQHPEEI